MSHQIIIEVKDSRILSSLRNVLDHIKGVSVVQQPEMDKTEVLPSSYEQSLDDLQNGRMNTYGSAEELFEKMGI